MNAPFPTMILSLHICKNIGHGYAVAIGRSTRCRDGIIRTRYIHCVRGGKPRDRVTARKKTFSQKTDCPFKCRAHLTTSTKEEERWELTVMNSVAYHQHRKFPSPIRQRIAAMTRSRVAPKEIASAISIESPDLTWTIQDIYNVLRVVASEHSAQG